MTLGLFLASASALISILTGITLWAKNTKKSITDRIYLLTSGVYILLGLTNYISTVTTGDTKLFYARSVIILTCWSVFLTYVLVVFLSDENVLSKQKEKIILYYGLFANCIISVLCMTPNIINGFVAVAPNVQYLRFGNGSIVFFVFLGLFSFLTLYILYKHIRYANDNNTRSKFRLLLVGFLPVIFIAPITSMYLPIRYGNLNLIDITPLYSAMFVLMVGYAMIRHQLFDIRLYVIRFIAFFIASIALSVLYVAPIIYIFYKIIGIEIHLAQYLIVILCFSVTAAYYHRLQDNFKKSTSRIFFQDIYESTDVLAHFNKTVASQVMLHQILESAVDLAANNFRSNYSVFMLDNTSDKTRFYGNGRISQDKNEELKELATDASRIPQPILFMNALKAYPKSYEIAAKEDVAIIAKITLHYEGRNDNTVYWFIGVKRSGTNYTIQDIQVLEAIIGTLAIAIKNALQYEEIQQFNVTLQQRVNDATRKLKASNERLKKLDETKDDFISMASHQLRTPLTSVKGYISMVMEGDAGAVNKDQRKMLAQAFMSSQRMVFLISDLLNLSRLNTGRFVIEPKPVNLRTVIAEEIAQLHDTALARGVTLVADMPPAFPELMLDETKIHQVVMNFIDNAVYYTPSGGTVTVRLSETPKAVELRVIDNGIGVPRHEQPHLFTKFYRAHNARQARPDGTGLGLFMAKKVIMAHGGVVLFESQEGKGSTFGFRFSKQKLAVSSAAVKSTEAVGSTVGEAA